MIDLLLNNPQLIIFAVIVILGGIRNIFGKKESEQADQYDQHPTPHRDDDPLSDFKRMIEEARRDAETQGSRPASPPPPELAPSPSTHHNTARRATTPVAKSVEPASPVPVRAIDVPPPKATAFPSKTQQRNQRRASNKSSLTALLSTPHSARQAIVLTEVLGKPRGMS